MTWWMLSLPRFRGRSGVQRGVVGGAAVAECGVQSVVVVVPDVVEQAGAGLCSGLEWWAGVDVFVLQRGEPGLHRCVVQRAAAFAEGDPQSVPGGQTMPVVRGELV